MTDSKIKWQEVLLTVGGLILFWLYMENQDQKKQIRKLTNDLASNEALTEEIRKKLKELILANPEIDSEVSNELAQLMVLIEVKQETKAILGLAKILENLFKHIYRNDSELIHKINEKGRKSPSFQDYLEHAREKGLISQEDYHLISVIKIIRNEEAHQLGVKKEKGRLVACFIAGLSLTFLLSKLKKRASE